MPFYPFKVLRAREHVPNFLFFCCFHFRFTFESFKELGITLVLAYDLRKFKNLLFEQQCNILPSVVAFSFGVINKLNFQVLLCSLNRFKIIATMNMDITRANQSRCPTSSI
jgi:hypothetical protein